MFALPKTAAIAAYVPVAQLVVYEALCFQAEGLYVVGLECSPRGLNQLLEVGKDPAVDVGTRGHRDIAARIELIQPCVIAEERVGVPELEDEVRAHFLGRDRAEVDVLRG